MEEQLVIEQQEPTQQDPPVKRLYQRLFDGELYTKTYDEFVKQFSTTEKVQKLYQKLNQGELYTKSEDEFYNQFFPEVKKKASSALPSISLDLSSQSPAQENEGLGSKISTVGISTSQDNIYKGDDPVELVKQAREIGKKQAEVASAVGLNALNNTELNEQAKRLREKVSSMGYDPDELYSEMGSLSEDDFKRIPKETLFEDRKKNNQLYQREISRLKWKGGLDRTLKESFENGNITPDEYNNLTMGINSALQNANVGDYKQQRGNINSIARIIKQYGGKDSDELLKQYAGEMSKIYGNSFRYGFDKAVSDDPNSKYMNNEALLGYHYIQDVDPDKAAQYEHLFIDPKTLKDKPDERKGYNHLMQTLEQTGINLQVNAINEELNNLNNIAEKNKGLTPEQLELSIKLEDKKKELYNKNEELDIKYPDRLKNKVNDAVQEIMGQNLGWVEYAGGRAGTALKNTVQGVWEAVSSPFMSEESNRMRELAIMGEKLEEDEIYHKTDKNKALLTDKLVIQPELQKKIDAIVNREDQEYPGIPQAAQRPYNEYKKREELAQLLYDNKEQFSRVPIAGGKFNISPSSILYGVTDIGTTLLPFIGLEAATGGGASAGLARKFLSTFTAAAATSFHDEYANALLEGKPQSEAYKHALASTAISSFAMAGAQTPQAIKQMAGLKTSAGQIINKMTDAEIEASIKHIPNALKGVVERVKATPGMFAKGLKSGAQFEVAMTGAAEAKHELLGTPINRENNFKQSVLNILNFGVLGAGLGQAGYKSPTELQRSAFVETGKNPSEYKAQADIMRKDGIISDEQHRQITMNIENAEKSYKLLPTVNAKGKPLSEKEKGDIMFNEAVKNQAEKEALTIRQKEKAEHIKLVADFKNDLILDPRTEKQLETRKAQLEKSLETEKDSEGKIIEPNPKEVAEAKAEIQAIDEHIEETPARIADERARELTTQKQEKEREQTVNDSAIENTSIPPEYNEFKTENRPEIQQPPKAESLTEKEPNIPIREAEKTTGEGEVPIEGKSEFDKLTSSIPNSGEVKKYLSGDTIKKYEGDELRNNQEITAQELRPALEHGIKVVEQAKQLFGEKEYVEKTLDYLQKENISPENKALIYVSLENELAKQRLNATPETELQIKKMQDLVRAKSQAYLRSSSLAINMGRLRKFAEVGYDVSKLTDRFFSSKELEQKAAVEKMVQSDANAINKEAEAQEVLRNEVEGFTPEEVTKLKEENAELHQKVEEYREEAKLKRAKKRKDIDEFFNKLKIKKDGNLYSSVVPVPPSIINGGIELMKQSVLAGETITYAVKTAIKHISDKFGKEWDKDKFEKEYTEKLKDLMASISKPVRGERNLEKEYVKQGLIDKGYGREITVTVKDGNKTVKEKRQIIDWKKLAGEEGSVEKIKEHVETYLKEKGIPESEISRMNEALTKEYTDLRASIIEKGLNELANRNKTTVTPEQKGAAKKLAEMYNYGLFEKNMADYENVLAKTVGLTGLSGKRMQEVQELGEALSKLFGSNFSGNRLGEPQLRTAIQVVEERMKAILNSEYKEQGNFAFKVSDIARTYFDAVQRMTLNNLKQAVENPLSGQLENLYSNIGYSGAETKAVSSQRRQLSRAVYKDIVLNKGTGYGDVSTTFVNRGNLETAISKMPDSQLLQAATSTALGKVTLDAADSFFKSKITQQKFIYNLIQILTRNRNVNGKVEKGMSKEDAKNFVAEKLSGQSFKEANEMAKNLIDKINAEAGRKVFSDKPAFVTRLANDIVTASLLNGDKVTKEMIDAAYNSAYRAAGRGLGHVANNYVSQQMQSMSAKMESEIGKSLKEKEYNKAAFLTAKSIVFRNFLNPFVGGGTNWVVLKAEKSGLGLLSGFASMLGRGEKIDLTSEAGIKNLEHAMYENLKIRDKFIRGSIGAITTGLAYLTFTQLAQTESYRKWRAKHTWASRYLDLITPEIILASMARKNNEFKKYLENSINRTEQYDKVKQTIDAAVLFSKGKPDEAWGKVGQVVGNTFGVPVPWRLSRDGQQIIQGISGNEPFKVKSKNPKSFWEGVFRGGLVDYLGFAPGK